MLCVSAVNSSCLVLLGVFPLSIQQHFADGASGFEVEAYKPDCKSLEAIPSLTFFTCSSSLSPC